MLPSPMKDLNKYDLEVFTDLRLAIQHQIIRKNKMERENDTKTRDIETKWKKPID